MTFHCRNCDDGVMIHRREHRYTSGAVYAGWTLLAMASLGVVMTFLELFTGSEDPTLLIIWVSVAVFGAITGQVLAHKRQVFRCDECGDLRVATPGVQAGKRRRGVASSA